MPAERLYRPLWGILLALSLLASVGAGRAAAWTEARVHTASAEVEVEADGSAIVEIALELVIDGGWLEGLEIAGLDPDLALLPEPEIALVSEEGQPFRPRVQTRSDGRVILSYRDRRSPRRGRYTTRFRYRTQLAERGSQATDHGAVRFTWTFPAWRSGLDGVHVRVSAPRGARLVPDENDTHSAIRHAESEVDGRAILSWRRAHLPRTTPWPVRFEIPNRALAPELRAPTPEPPPPLLSVPHTSAEGHPSLLALVGLFAAVALLGRALFDRSTRRRGGRPRPLVPVGKAIHGISVLAVAGVAAAAAEHTPAITGLALCALLPLMAQRSPIIDRPSKLGGFRPLRRGDAKRARLAGLKALVEPVAFVSTTRPQGWLVLGLALWPIFQLAAAEAPSSVHEGFTVHHGAALLAIAMLLTSPSLLPSTAGERLLALLAIARRWRVDLDAEAPVALRALVHEDATGVLQDARVRLSTPTRPKGLLRFDLAITDVPTLGATERRAVLLIVTRVGTVAETKVAEALPRATAQHGPGGRRARVLPLTQEPKALLRALTVPAEGEEDGERPSMEAGAPDTIVDSQPSPLADGRA